MFITTAYRRCLTLLFLINAFLNDCPYHVVYVIRSGWQEAVSCLVWSPESCVAAAQCSVVCLKLRQSRQQFDRCLAATVWAARHHSNMHHAFTFTPGCMKTTPELHSLDTQTETNMFIRNQWGIVAKLLGKPDDKVGRCERERVGWVWRHRYLQQLASLLCAISKCFDLTQSDQCSYIVLL